MNYKQYRLIEKTAISSGLINRAAHGAFKKMRSIVKTTGKLDKKKANQFSLFTSTLGRREAKLPVGANLKLDAPRANY